MYVYILDIYIQTWGTYEGVFKCRTYPSHNHALPLYRTSEVQPNLLANQQSYEVSESK